MSEPGSGSDRVAAVTIQGVRKPDINYWLIFNVEQTQVEAA